MKQVRHINFPGTKSIGADLSAALAVFLVAMPLCLGIALASGAPLSAGVIAGCVGGILIGCLSGSELSVSGPAAGLAIISLGAIQKLGSFETFGLAVVISGVFQIFFGYLRGGSVGDYIPNSVIKGFLAGIGLVTVLKQIPHALGDDRDFEGDNSFFQPDRFNTFSEIKESVMALSPGAILISAVGLILLVFWGKPVVRKVSWTAWMPGPLVVVVVGMGLNELFRRWIPAWELTAANDHLVHLPLAGSFSEFKSMFRPPEVAALTRPAVWGIALTIALVGSIETLLSIEATDKLDPQKRISDTNRELRAQGIGNMVSGLLGGLPITSVILRGSVNVYSGARSRTATVIHGILLALAVLVLAPMLNRIPLAALAAVLIVVGVRLASWQVIREVWRMGKAQFIPFIVTVMAIVVTDPLRGFGVGLLVSLYFVLRANHHAAVTLVHDSDNWLMRFNKDVSFVHKAEIKRRLREIPDGASLIVDGTRALYVDRDIYETLQEFETAASFRGIRLDFRNLKDKLPKRA